MIKKTIIILLAFSTNLQAADAQYYQGDPTLGNKIPIRAPEYLEDRTVLQMNNSERRIQEISHNNECLSLCVCSFVTAILTFTGTYLFCMINDYPGNK